MSFFASVGKPKPVLGVKIKKVKGALEHIGLYVGLALYTAVGAKVLSTTLRGPYHYHIISGFSIRLCQVFQMIENSHEMETLTTQQATLVTERELFIRNVGDISRNKVTYREVRIIFESNFLDKFFPDCG